MIEYKCIRCNKIFKKKPDYTRHTNRKILCKSTNSNLIPKQSKTLLNHSQILSNNLQILPKNDLKCNYCDKSFNQSYNINRHIKNYCKMKKENDNEKLTIFNNLLEEMNQLKQKLDKQEQKLTEQEQKNNKLQEELTSFKKMSKNNIVNSNNNSNNKITNNTTNNIQLIAFGKETMDKIDKKDILKALKKGYYSTVELTDQMHFNPKIPEHHNIYIPNLKDKYTMIYDGSKWNLKLTEIVIDDLYDNKKIIIESSMKEFAESLNDSQQYSLEKWIETPDEDNKITNVKEQFKLLLHNKKNIPLTTKKNNNLLLKS
jgi:uncharacterized C2H2 Zn-finger protein